MEMTDQDQGLFQVLLSPHHKDQQKDTLLQDHSSR
jgi:hypothetical protein